MPGRLIMELTLSDKAGTAFATRAFAGSCKVTASDVKKSGGKIRLSLSLPIRDIIGYFTADTTDGPVPRLDWTISFSGYSSCNCPLLCFYSQSDSNRYTLFADNLTDDFSCVARMNQQTGNYDVSWTFAATKPFALYLDTKAGPWTAAIARSMKTLRPGGRPYFPAGAWAPVYCTWYAAHAWLTNDFLDRNAKFAAELGCGTFIVDDGWCYDEMKRVSPQTIDTWYDDIGDWKVSEKKLPDFKAHIAYAQSLGLNYLLWVAPYFCFKNSAFYKSLPKDTKTAPARWGTSVFDIRNVKLCSDVIGRMLSLVRDLGLNGLKVDFLDVIDGDVDAPVGAASLAFIRKLSAGIRRYAGRDALIEFRQRYATPQMLDYGTQFRAGDVPFDYLRNLGKLAAIRVLLGDKVPVHADPLYWRPDELDVTVARHMIASLSSVPMLSMDLAALTKSHRAIVSHYLGFYREHIRTFSQGHWEVRFNGSVPAYLSVTRGKERIVILVDDKWLGAAAGAFRGTCHLLNFSANPVAAAEAFSLNGNKLKSAAVPAGGRGIL